MERWRSFWATPAEVERILNPPELVEAAREGMRKDLGAEGATTEGHAGESGPTTVRVVAGGLQRSDGLLGGSRRRLQRPAIWPRLTEGG